MASDFYLRYYVGHKGKFGHEFLEFEFRPDGESGTGGLGEVGPRSRGVGYRSRVARRGLMPGLSLPTGKLRYANNSNYKNDVMIRKEVRAAEGVCAGKRGSGQGSGLDFVAGVLWAGVYLFLCRNVVSRLTCTRV